MPDDAIERARVFLERQYAGGLPTYSATEILYPESIVLRAIIACASQQAPEGWMPIDEAKPGQIGTFWITSIDADEGGWYKFGSVAKADPLLCILDDDDRGYWPHENGGYATHFQPVPAPPAMLDAAPSVTLGEVG